MGNQTIRSKKVEPNSGNGEKKKISKKLLKKIEKIEAINKEQIVSIFDIYEDCECVDKRANKICDIYIINEDQLDSGEVFSLKKHFTVDDNLPLCHKHKKYTEKKLSTDQLEELTSLFEEINSLTENQTTYCEYFDYLLALIIREKLQSLSDLLNSFAEIELTVKFTRKNRKKEREDPKTSFTKIIYIIEQGYIEYEIVKKTLESFMKILQTRGN